MAIIDSAKPLPVVSVWIITYNHGKFIRQCLESVMQQQTDFAFEVIIGEDCSTDNTREIIQEFESQYPNVIKPVYQDKNVGAYRNAYEFCYPKLTGTFIACLEADDYWTDVHKLQKQVDALRNDEKAVACFTQVSVLLNNEDRFEEHWSTAYNSKKSRYNVVDILAKFNIVTCTLMFKNVYRKLPYDPLAYPTGDVSLSAFLLLRGDALFLNEITAVYRVHDGGIFSVHSLEKKNLVFVKIFEQLLTEPLFRRYTGLLEKLLADRCYQALCFEIKKAEPDQLKIEEYYNQALSRIHAANFYYPFKAFMRKRLFDLTGKSFGRTLN